jgi:hypothetical protein
MRCGFEYGGGSVDGLRRLLGGGFDAMVRIDVKCYGVVVIA